MPEASYSPGKNQLVIQTGSLKRLESYSLADKLQTSSEYDYDENGNKINWTVEDGEGIVLSVTKYIYESGLNTGIEIYGHLNETA